MLTVEVPDELARIFPPEEGGASLSQRALEALVIEAVREGRISRGRARELLRMDLEASEALFAARGLTYDHTLENLEEQLAAIRKAEALQK